MGARDCFTIVLAPFRASERVEIERGEEPLRVRAGDGLAKGRVVLDVAAAKLLDPAETADERARMRVERRSDEGGGEALAKLGGHVAMHRDDVGRNAVDGGEHADPRSRAGDLRPAAARHEPRAVDAGEGAGDVRLV